MASGENKSSATGASLRQAREAVLTLRVAQFYIDSEATAERVVFAALRWQYALYFPQIANSVVFKEFVDHCEFPAMDKPLLAAAYQSEALGMLAGRCAAREANLKASLASTAPPASASTPAAAAPVIAIAPSTPTQAPTPTPPSPDTTPRASRSGTMADIAKASPGAKATPAPKATGKGGAKKAEDPNAVSLDERCTPTLVRVAKGVVRVLVDRKHWVRIPVPLASHQLANSFAYATVHCLPRFRERATRWLGLYLRCEAG